MRKLAWAACVCGFVFSSAVSATTFVFKYEGTAWGSYNYLNMFGGGSLDDLPFVATFVMKYPLDGVQTNSWSNGQVINAAAIMVPEFMTGDLTINGITVSVPVYGASVQKQDSPIIGDAVGNGVTEAIDGNELYIEAHSYSNSLIGSLDLLEPFSSEGVSDLDGAGWYHKADPTGESLGTHVELLIGSVEGYVLEDTTPGNPAPPEEIPDPTGAVPEPSTWMLLLAGFSAIGAMLRTRRRAIGLGVAT